MTYRANIATGTLALLFTLGGCSGASPSEAPSSALEEAEAIAFDECNSWELYNAALSSAKQGGFSIEKLNEMSDVIAESHAYGFGGTNEDRRAIAAACRAGIREYRKGTAYPG